MRARFAIQRLVAISTLVGVVFFLSSSVVRALINYDADNTDGTGVPLWDQVVNFNGATGLYMGNGWIVTANHVGRPSTVTINGSAHSTNASSTTRIMGEDLLLFRLEDWSDLDGMLDINPTIGWRKDPVSGLAPDHLLTVGTIGYGKGRGDAVTGGWKWGGTSVKRWGIMRLETSPNSLYTIQPFWATLGDNSAAATLGDSGSPLFYEDANGLHLAGVTFAVSENSNSESRYSNNQTFTASQRMAGILGAEIYRITEVWGLEASTTASVNDNSWTGNKSSAIRILTSGVNSFETGNIGVLDVTGETTLKADNIGTLVMRDQAHLKISESSTSIQTVTGEGDSWITVEETDLGLGQMKGDAIKLRITSNSTVVAQYMSNFSESSGNNFHTVEIGGNSTLTAEKFQTGHLIIHEGATLINGEPVYVDNGGGGSWTTYGIRVLDSLQVDEGAEISTFNFVAGASALVNIEGTLFARGPAPSVLYAQNTTFAEDSTIAWTMETGRQSRIDIMGSGTLLLENNLELREGQYAAPNTDYILMSAGRQDAFEVNFANLNAGRLKTEWGSFAISTSWDGENLRLIANDFQAIPEPTTVTVLIVAAGLTGALRRRKRNLVRRVSL